MHTDLRDRLAKVHEVEDFRKLCLEMKERRKNVDSKDKIGWYYRHWKNMGLDPASSATFSTQAWDD